jgi:hypothetical protein
MYGGYGAPHSNFLEGLVIINKLLRDSQFTAADHTVDQEPFFAITCISKGRNRAGFKESL